MHGYEIPNLRFSALAGAALPKRRFVTVNSSEKAVLPAAGAAIIGVTSNITAAVDEVVNMYDGIVMVDAAGTIAAGAKVQTNAEGKAVVVSTGEAVGMAMTGAVSGGVVTVKIG